MKRKLNIAPKQWCIASMQATDIPWAEALSELIDNSLDAKAKEINITFTEDNSVTVEDDGSGCDDLEAMLSLGSHSGRSTADLGRYGVGLKNAAASLANELAVTTYKGGVRRHVRVVWSDLIKQETWEAESLEEKAGSQTGTFIKLEKLSRRRPGNIALYDELSSTFSPAIESGVVITLDNEPLTARKKYKFSECLERTTWLDGVGYRAFGGILAEGTHTHGEGPFVLAYKHRILGSTSEPCGDFNTSDRFICYVELLESEKGIWTLKKHKDGLIETDVAKWLYDQLKDYYSPMLERLHKEGESLELKDIEAELNHDLLLSCGIIGRENRTRGNTDGTAEPADTEKKRLTAEKVSDEGEVTQRNPTQRRPARGVSMTFGHLNGRIGKVDINGKRVQIILNLNHPAIAAWKADKANRGLAYHLVALSLLAGHQSIIGRENKGQLILGKVVCDSQWGMFINCLSEWASNKYRKDETA